ncbi:hypothetical protein [Microvirus sp.]|nr:hypothetical protein [Microvirus sp.]UYL88445.1 hypothetical protein [Microvirus sp.]UYL88467.1 hypothetical protein [Microvirus sp.]
MVKDAATFRTAGSDGSAPARQARVVCGSADIKVLDAKGALPSSYCLRHVQTPRRLKIQPTSGRLMAQQIKQIKRKEKKLC